MTSIQVFLGQPRPGSPANFVGRPPIAEVLLAPGPADDPIPSPKVYYALIDTGSDYTAIDGLAAAEIGAETIGRASVRAMGAEYSEVSAVNVEVIFPGPQFAFSTRAAVLDLRGAGQSFDLILGRSFLQHCRLVSDGPRNSYCLDFLTPN